MKKTFFILSAVLGVFAVNTDAFALSNSRVATPTSTGLYLNGFQGGDGVTATLVTRRYGGGHRHYYKGHRYNRHFRSHRFGHNRGFRFNHYRPYYKPYRNFYQRPYRGYNNYYRGGGYSGYSNHRNHHLRHDNGHNKGHGRHSSPNNRY